VIHRGHDMHTGFCCKKLEERDHLKNIGIDGKIILTWILNRVGRCDLD
jgi:hypothetical protein